MCIRDRTNSVQIKTFYRRLFDIYGPTQKNRTIIKGNQQKLNNLKDRLFDVHGMNPIIK